MSCSQNKSPKPNLNKTVSFPDSTKIYSIFHDKSLTIEARFSECGEWGGHKEMINVSSANKKAYDVVYKIFPYNCDSLSYYYANDTLKPAKEIKVVLNERKEKAIINYMYRFFESKLTESFPGHAGNIFTMANSDSTFFIRVYDNKQFDVTSFRQLVTELFR
jgi:hypothetical protein